MTKLILLVTLAVVGQLVKGQDLAGTVTCHDNHTVDITITNVDDIDQWTDAAEWRLENNTDCEPTIDQDSRVVNYTGLVLPDCAFEEQQFADSIKYILKVSAKRDDPGGAGQLRLYDYLFFVSCDYDNQDNTSVASFVPIVNRGDNDTSNAFFTFTLDVYTDDAFFVSPPAKVALDVPLYLKAEVVTQSAAPNLDLFLVSCWASSSAAVDSGDNKVTLITDGCGKDSEDTVNTLVYNCTDNDKTETFSINSFRYYNFTEGSSVFFHCNLRVCLADFSNSSCECPTDSDCYNARKRKRRSVDNFVEEVHVRSGPYTFADDTEKDKVESEEQDEPQSFSTNLAIIVAVSGVVVVAVIVCATVFLVVRNRNKRSQDGDLNVVT
ncbi:hypothetical protein ACROYT_G039793 [Oculina patagonica]